MTRLLLVSILLAAAVTASAADTALYKVELIVFENLDPAAVQAEQWPTDPGTPPLDNAKDLNALITASASATSQTPVPVTAAAIADAPPGVVAIPAITATAAANVTAPANSPATNPVAPDVVPVQATPQPPPVIPIWRWLDPSERTLDEVERKLTNSGRYHTLLHIGWVQPLDASDQGTPIHIFDGLAPGQYLGAPGSVPQAAAPQALAPPLPAVNQQGLPAAISPGTAETPGQTMSVHVLDGTFAVSRGRYLHVDTDLGYHKTYVPPGTSADGSALPPATLYVRMTQSRRLRSDELHYLDHPLIGMLLVVSPLQTTAPDTAGK
jgi:hypothetical protein